MTRQTRRPMYSNAMVDLAKSHAKPFLLTIPLILALPLSAGAQITGEIAFEGPVPRPQPLNMSSDPTCERLDPLAVSQALRITKGRVSDVFAYILDAPAKDQPVRGTVRLAVRGCQFSPRVVGLRVGQKLEILNEDDTLHSARVPGRRSDQVRRLPKKGSRVVHRFSDPKVPQRIRCDIHGWSNAYAAVLDHPYFGVSNRQGQLQIPTVDLADGIYRVRLWHEVLGQRTIRVTVKQGKGRFNTVLMVK